jgi:hypothetical protein
MLESIQGIIGMSAKLETPEAFVAGDPSIAELEALLDERRRSQSAMIHE